MHNPFLVRRRQAARDLHRVLNRLALSERPGAQPLPKRLALQQLGDHVGRLVRLPDVIYGEDVGMVQSAGGPCFLLKAMEALRIFGE